MKAPKPEKTLAPAGTHMARLVGIIYIGTIHNKMYDRTSYRIRLTWELPNELHQFKEGDPQKPFVVSKELSLSMGKKATLRPIVEGMIGTSLDDDEAYNFDIDTLLDMPCLLSLTHEEGEMGKFVAINSASQLLKGVACPPRINDIKVLSFDKWNEAYFQTLPDFIKDKIKSTKEYAAMTGNAAAYPQADPDAGDIPF